MNSLVSVVIPNYNGAPFLAEAVSSVIEQDYENIEIIVIDDGSTDNSVELLRKFGPKIRLIETRNGGASSARNFGLVAAKGEYIALLDSDDIWATNKIGLQMEYMKRNDLDLVYCHGQEFGNAGGLNFLHEAKYAGDCYKYFKKYPGRAIIDMGPSTALFKKSRLKRTGLFDASFTGLAEDWDFFRRYCVGAKVGFCDQVLVFRRNHAGNMSNQSLNEYFVGNRKALLKMFAEDPEISCQEQKLILTKFYYLFIKSLVRKILK